MTWLTRYKDKPAGLYKAQSLETSCSRCAYLSEGNKCTVRKQKIDRPEKTKCRDFMSAEAGIPETEQ